MSIFSGDGATERAEAFLGGIPYTRASGMKAAAFSAGRASLILPARPEWTGDSGRQLIHPGCASVLADTTAGLAVATALEQIEAIATLDLRMDYLRPAVAGRDLLCEAHCHRVTANVAFVRGEVRTAGEAEPVATVNAAFMRATASTPRPAGSSPGATGAATGRSTKLAPTGGLTVPADLTPCDAEGPALPSGISPYVDYLDVRRCALADGTPLFRLPFRPDLIGNPILPALHGGVLAGFGETALVLHLVFTNHLGHEGVPKGVDFHIDYLRSARPIDTFAHCTTVRQGSRVALVQVSLWQDDPARPVAVARGHLLLPREP